jgi:hypothetical protein
MMTLQFFGAFDIVSEFNDVLYGCEQRDRAGIYLWAVLVDGQYRVTYVGETGASFYRRTKEHIIQTLGGNYRVCDAAAMRQGIQNVLWDGLWRKGTRDKLPEFLERYQELAPHIKEYLRAQVIFLAATECDDIMRKRIETAIALAIRSDVIASSLFPEDIRFRKPKGNELPVKVKLLSESRIMGLPSEILA